MNPQDIAAKIKADAEKAGVTTEEYARLFSAMPADALRPQDIAAELSDEIDALVCRTREETNAFGWNEVRLASEIAALVNKGAELRAARGLPEEHTFHFICTKCGTRFHDPDHLGVPWTCPTCGGGIAFEQQKTEERP